MFIIIIQVWDKDVKFFHVKDSSGSPVEYFYFDPYCRPSEKGKVHGWMKLFLVAVYCHLMVPHQGCLLAYWCAIKHLQ